MPFGSQLLAGGGVRFRLWAPSAREVALCLEAPNRRSERAMARVGGGWFEATDAAAAPGWRYRYRIDGGLCVRYRAGVPAGLSRVILCVCYLESLKGLSQ